MRQGKFPKMNSVTLVHDANYFNVDPKDINVYTIYNMWDIFRNPSTKKYFGFQIEDVDLSMDFSIGRDMAEELPFIPGYNYQNLLDPNFSSDEYMELHRQYIKENGPINIKNFPKLFNKELKDYEKVYGYGR